MFATLAGGYPLGPLPGGVDDLLTARARLVAGEVGQEAFDDFLEAWTVSVIDEQVGSGLSLVSDADGRWPDGQPGLARDLLSGAITPDDVVTVWRHADAAADILVKQVLPGPWTAARALAPSAADRAAVARDMVERLGATMRALSAARCPLIEVHEPAATRPDAAEDGASLVDTLAALADAVPPGTQATLALPEGAVPPVLQRPIAALPFRSFLIDVVSGPDAWRLLALLPPETGVVVGALDAGTTATDDPEMLVWAATLAAEMDGRGHERVGIAPSGSLAGMDRYRARTKIGQLGMAVRLARMGPLGEVARALQPEPGTCRIGSLRRLYRDWEEARVAVGSAG
jgi:methionine synthase II (cobalamin-independent)